MVHFQNGSKKTDQQRVETVKQHGGDNELISQKKMIMHSSLTHKG